MIAVVAVELGRLGFDLRRGLERRLGLRHAVGVLATRAFSDATWTSALASMRLSSWAARLDGAGPAEPGVALARAALRSSATSLRFCSSRSLIRRLTVIDVGVLVGVALHQRVEVALLLGDARVDLRRGDRDRRLLQQALRGQAAATALFLRQLGLGGVACVLGFAQLELGLLELAVDLGHAGGGVLAVGGLHVEVAQAELLQPCSRPPRAWPRTA
jgi:hypothetical protein